MVNTIRTAGHVALVQALISARRAAGLTQRELAEKIGTRHSGIANIETGQRRIDVIELVALALVLNLDAMELFRVVVENVDEAELRGNFSRTGY